MIGTTAQVHPAAGYVQVARNQGARVAVVNMDGKDLGSAGSLKKGYFWFQGDAAIILPDILKEIVGGLEEFVGVAGEVHETKKADPVSGDDLEEEEEMDEVQESFAASP